MSAELADQTTTSTTEEPITPLKKSVRFTLPDSPLLSSTLPKLEQIQNEQGSIWNSDSHHWLVDIYCNLWQQQQQQSSSFNFLTVQELTKRYIDIQSPKWFFLPVQKLKHIRQEKYRQILWKQIKEELLMYIQKTNLSTQQLVYSYHNIAILNFFTGHTEEACSILDYLLEKNNLDTQVLQTICFFYLYQKEIDTPFLYKSASILYYLLQTCQHTNGETNEWIGKKFDWHCIYLIAHLITNYIQLLDRQLVTNEIPITVSINSTSSTMPWLSLFSQWLGIPHESNTCSLELIKEEIKELREFRSCIMECICQYKPKNHLYKLWKLQWNNTTNTIFFKDETSNETFTKEECIENCQQFLKHIMNKYHSTPTLPMKNSQSMVVVNQYWSIITNWLLQYKWLFKNSVWTIIITIIMYGITKWIKQLTQIKSKPTQNIVSYSPMLSATPEQLLQHKEQEIIPLQKYSIQSMDSNANKPRQLMINQQGNEEEVFANKEHVMKPFVFREVQSNQREDKAITRDFEYVDHLYQEVLTNTSQLLKTEPHISTTTTKQSQQETPKKSTTTTPNIIVNTSTTNQDTTSSNIDYTTPSSSTFTNPSSFSQNTSTISPMQRNVRTFGRNVMPRNSTLANTSSLPSRTRFANMTRR